MKRSSNLDGRGLLAFHFHDLRVHDLLPSAGNLDDDVKVLLVPEQLFNSFTDSLSAPGTSGGGMAIGSTMSLRVSPPAVSKVTKSSSSTSMHWYSSFLTMGTEVV